MKNRFNLILVVVLHFIAGLAYAQTGLDVTPPRTYYISSAGVSTVNKIKVSNPSKDNSLTLAVSLNDWEYDEKGNNIITEPRILKNSAAHWISIKPQSYFTLAPGESQEIEVTLTAPKVKIDSLDVHTALLFITQTNPIDSYNEQGALIKISLRSGVKLYHRYNTPAKPSIEFTEYRFNKEAKNLELALENNGNIWTDGTVATELVNLNTGTKHKLEDQIIYTLPADKRKVTVALPKGLKPGKYTASSVISYGDDDTIKMAELAFVYD